MNNLWARVFCLLLLGAGCLLGAEDEPPTLVVEPQGEGEFDYDPRTGLATAARGVVVRYGKAILSAHQATVNQITGEVLAEGQVHIENEGQTWKGDRIIYNFKTRQLSTGAFRTGQAKFYVEGPALDVNLTNRVYTLTNAVVTTDDYAQPLYTIRAKSVTLVPGRYIRAKNATLWVGQAPVFWMPMMRRSLEHHPNFWVFTPGYRSLFGPYLLSSYHRVWNPELETALDLDYRVKRGVGLGPEIFWNSPTVGESALKYYYAHDEDPGHDPQTGQALPDNRQRLWFSHKVTLRTNLTAKAMVRYQSDAYIVRDFFESEYRENIQPSTFVEANQDWSDWNLNLLVQPRVNDFQETIQRLPDLKLTGLRQEIGQSPFFYESESSLGYYRHVWPDPTPGVVYPLPYEAMRADTYHQVLAPLNLFGWLNIAPRAGQRFTYYGEANGAGAATEEEGRAVFNTGVEVSTKASRLWRNTRSDLLDVRGVRHIVEPSINYAYVPNPHPSPSRLPQFDSNLPTYWLLPVDFPDYNNIDSIDSQNVMRFSLRNRLQTKRAEGLEDLLDWRLFADWRLKPDTNQTTFSSLYSILDFRPRSWLTLSSLTRYEINQGRLRELNHIVTFHPAAALNLSVGHRYRDGEEFGPTDLGNNLILSSISYRFNENWGARATFQFEARDGVMEEQSYTLYRDLRSWTAALTLRYRDNRSGPNDYTVALTFSLKAFPRYALGEDVDRPSRLLGY
jgi:lipopolysaccharide assembly outer membrane protein LptD (OstA)